MNSTIIVLFKFIVIAVRVNVLAIRQIDLQKTYIYCNLNSIIESNCRNRKIKLCSVGKIVGNKLDNQPSETNADKSISPTQCHH